MPEFIPGRELSRLFYHEAVRPILDSRFPGLEHTACLIGTGSDVLGYDTFESTDHEWGPRLRLFLSQDDWDKRADDIDGLLSAELPRRFRGFSTSFSEQDEEGVRVLVDAEDGPIRHGVRIGTLNQFFKSSLRIDPFGEISPAQWLTFSEQSLLEVARAAVYHDDFGLAEVQTRLTYYPHDVRLYLLASQWRRIDQLEPFMGRSGNVGDELGSKLIAHQIVLDLVRLCFLMEKRYAPYAKWLGTAFRELDCTGEMMPLMTAVLDAHGWEERQTHLSRAYELVATTHNGLRITEPLSIEVRPFHGRPYLVSGAGRFVSAISKRIIDPSVQTLPDFLGSVDQISHSVDILTSPHRREVLQGLYKLP